MTTANAADKELSAGESRRRIARALLRALAVAAALVTVYFLAPLDRLADVPLGWFLAIGMLALIAVSFYHVKSIIQSPHPGTRAIEGFVIVATLFLLLFSTTYFVMAQTDPANFSVDALTRTDALYFVVTVFSTVGFGDITATSQAARIVVTVQMVLDLVLLGLGIKVLVGAVRVSRQRTSDGSSST
jgi:voltage-gated potassium channel